MDNKKWTKSQNTLLSEFHFTLEKLLQTSDEAAYFELSAALLSQCGEFIKDAHFAKLHKRINYSTQALEYALDNLQDEMHGTLEEETETTI